MNEAEINDFALIDIHTWADYTQSAMSSSQQSWMSHFSKLICQFLIHTYGARTSRNLLIFCGHESRFEMTDQLIGAALEHALNVYVVLPTLHLNSFKQQLKNALHISVLSEQDQFPDEIFCAIDLIFPLLNNFNSANENKLMALMNACQAPKIAIECPSGIDANTGHMIAKQAVNVDYTLESFFSKQGLWTGDGKTYAGRAVTLLKSIDSGFSKNGSLHLMHEQFIKQIAPQRTANQHKGCFSRVLVIAGEESMLGASLLAARGALVMGAGLVKLIYQQGLVVEHGQCPELIYQDVSKASDILHFVEDGDIILFGPGLGQGKWANQVWKTLQPLNHRMVVDASALEKFAKHPSSRPNWVITPHPGEAGQLLHKTASVVQANRFEAIQSLYQLYQATVVLKGAGTMVLGNQYPLYICPLGNPGMATPGMGDILSGLIAGSWAQGLSSSQAALYAVWMHALAGDEVQKKSMNGIVLASQVLQQIQCGLI